MDTDGDGLADEEEFRLHTCVGPGPKCPKPGDTDGDGYSDFVEARNVRAGFDPLDPMLPTTACSARGDSDGDGLLDCEEQALRTDPRLFDTDADRLPDLLEVRAGLDPLDPGDAASDPDRDTVRSADEVKIHTNPVVADQDGRSGDSRYGYDVTQTDILPGDVTCYSMVVRNIRLLTTGNGTDAVKGKNRVFLYFIEALKDRPQDYGSLRVACVDTRYVDGLFKSPASGKLQLTDKQFVAPSRLNPDKDCIDLTAVVDTPDGGAGG